MKFNSIYNPVWADAEHSAINVMIDTDSVQTPTIPFTASPDDNTDYGPQIYQSAVDGVFGEIAEFTPVVVTPEQVVFTNTQILNRLIKDCSNTAFPLQSAVSLGVATEAQKGALKELQQYSVDLLNTDLTTSPLKLPSPPNAMKAYI